MANKKIKYIKLKYSLIEKKEITSINWHRNSFLFSIKYLIYIDYKDKSTHILSYNNYIDMLKDFEKLIKEYTQT